jgi:hypothetical protein
MPYCRSDSPTRAFSSLRDYLQKTKSRLLLPEVVVEELILAEDLSGLARR